MLRGFQTKRFQRSASTWRVQLSVAVTTVRLNGSSLLLCQHLSQCWLDKIKKALSGKSDPSRCSVGSTILLFSWVGTAPEVREEREIYASRFFSVVFLENIYELSFTSPGFAQFSFHFFLHSCQIEFFFYECLWRGDRGPWYRKFSAPYHRWPELYHYIYYFVQPGEAFTVKGNNHTHTKTHTHTQTHTTEPQQVVEI